MPSDRRGLLKQELTRLGYPVLDHAGYMDGQYLNILWRGEKSDSGVLKTPTADPTISAFSSATISGRSPIPSGMSAVKAATGPCPALRCRENGHWHRAMRDLQCETLILTSNTTSVRQWIAELRENLAVRGGDR